MRTTLSVACVPVRDLNLHRASDREIFIVPRLLQDERNPCSLPLGSALTSRKNSVSVICVGH